MSTKGEGQAANRITFHSSVPVSLTSAITTETIIIITIIVNNKEMQVPRGQGAHSVIQVSFIEANN